MIVLDTDVLVIYHFFQNDPRYNATRLLFEKVAAETKGVTIFNLLELSGIIAGANKLIFGTEGASGLHITQHRLLSQLLHLIYKPRIL